MKGYLYSDLFKLVSMHHCFKRHVSDDDADEWYDRMLDHAAYVFGSEKAFRVIDAMGAFEAFNYTTWSEETTRLADFLGICVEDDWDDEGLGDEEDEPEEESEEDDPFDGDPCGYLELQADLMRDRIRDEMMEAV